MDPKKMCDLMGGCRDEDERRDPDPPEPPNQNWWWLVLVIVLILIVVWIYRYIFAVIPVRQIENRPNEVIGHRYLHRRAKEGVKKYKQ